MPDYTPPYLGRVVTLAASAAITGGQVVEVSGSGTVQPCATAVSQKVIGVAANDTPANGRVSVYGFGPVHESVVSTAGGTVTAGDQVQSGAAPAGSVQTVPAVTTPTPADVNNARSVMGVALTTATTPNKVRWMEGL